MESIYIQNNGGIACVGDELAAQGAEKSGAIRHQFGDRRIPDGALTVYRTNEIGGWFGVARSGGKRLCRFRSFDRALSAAQRLAGK